MANQQQYWQFEIFGTDPDLIGFFGNSGILLPSGTTAERPTSPAIGHMRLNTDTALFEGYNGAWNSFGSGSVSTFDSLTDTPVSKVGAGNRVMIVSSTETDLEYSPILELENSGRLRVAGGYESLVDADTVITNKKYTDDQDNLQLSLTGGLMGGTITMGSNAITGLPLSPTSASDATSKSYVDGLFAGIDRKESVNLATTTDLDTETGDTWIAAGAKVGKTITSNTNTATIDTVALVNGDRLLVKNEVGDIDNGIYDVSGVGGAVVVLTRSSDTDGSPASEVNGGATTFVVFGSTNALSQWSVIANGVVDVDVDAMVWSPTGAVSGAFLELAGGDMVGTIVMDAAGIQISGNTSSATAPAYSFTGDLGTGLHQINGAGTMSLLVATASIWNISSTAFTPQVNISQDIGSSGLKVKDIYADHFLPNLGAAGDPSYAFEGATTTGMYNDGSGGISFAIGGTDSIGIAGSNTITTPDGAVAGTAGLDMTLAAGSGHATSGDGGSINITAGSASGSGDGGSIILDVQSGAGTVGVDGSISFQRDGTEFLNFAAGSGLITVPDALGNDISLTAGTGTVTGTGGAIVITAGAGGATEGDGGSVDITAGAGIDAYTGGAVNLTGGAAETGGALVLTGGAASVENGGVINLIGGTTSAEAKYGGDVYMTGGTSTYAGDAYGGYVIITGGAGTSYGADVTITGGASTDAGGESGSVTLQGGEGGAYAGGIEVRAGDGAVGRSTGDVVIAGGYTTPGGTSAGGYVILRGGSGDGTYAGGQIQIDSGNVPAGGDAAGGDILVTTGRGRDANRAGDFVFTGGISSTDVGGSFHVTGGSSATGTSGAISLTGGLVTGTSGAGGDITIIGGNGGSASGDAGDITLQAGATAGAGSAGAIVIPDQTAPSSTTNKLYAVGGALTWNGADLTAPAVNQYTETFVDGDLTAGVHTVTHSLGRQYVHVTVYDNNNVLIQPDSVTATSTSVTTIDLTSFGTLTGTWYVVIS